MENIIKESAGKFVETSTILYGGVVNKVRQLPLVYDGLKPVYRRAIYAAIKFNGEHVKTAKLVGEMISNLHPSGDASCVPVISNLVHYGILDGRGNHGTKKLDGQVKPNAAPRYTEAWISPKYDAIFKPLLDYVPWQETELNSTEPCYLPTPIPLCMTFGLLGIGHGVLTRIPCFTAKSLFNALIADDPNLLEAPYGLQIVKEESELDKLWTTGLGKVCYTYKVYQGTSDDGTKGVYIEGIPEYYVPDLGCFDEWREYNKVFINDETDRNTSRIFIGKNKNIRVISTDEIYEMAWFVARYKKTFRLSTAFKDYVCLTPLREWLRLTYENYLTLVEKYKADKLDKLQKQEQIFIHSKEVANEFLKDTERSNQEIASKLGLEDWIVDAVLRKSISSLRKTDYEPKLAKVRQDIESFNKLDSKTYTADIVSKL